MLRVGASRALAFVRLTSIKQGQVLGIGRSTDMPAEKPREKRCRRSRFSQERVS